MSAHVTSPPNRQFLGDTVIGNVIERTRVAHTDGAASYQQRLHFVDTEDVCSDSLPSPSNHDMKLVSDRKQNRHSAMSVRTPTRNVLDAGTTKSTPKATSIYVDEDWVIAAIHGQKRLRELRRDRQRRYRKKQQDWMLTLEKDTHRLREEVEELEQQRRNLSPLGSTHHNTWSIAIAYFEIFRNGDASTSFTQRDFVQSTMTLDVVFNGGRGSDALIEIRWFSSSFQDYELELQHLKKDTENSLVAINTTKFVFTQQTLEKLFPHLCSSERGGHPRSLLINRLRGQQIAVPGTTRFMWDDAKGRMTSIMSRSDLLTPILKLVGNVESLARVFEHYDKSSTVAFTIVGS